MLFPFASVTAYLSALFFIAIKGPIEEIGWRGLALPLLQRKMAPIWAALVCGIVWAVWHLPAFMLSSTPKAPVPSISPRHIMIIFDRESISWLLQGNVPLFH